MSLLSYTQIEDNTPANANVFNERFGAIHAEMNGKLNSQNMAPKGIARESIADDVFTKIYPLGSIYINAVDATNPASLLGFGIWSAFGAGRVPVGIAASGTFAAPGAEVGTETVALTGAQNGPHTHTGNTDAAGNHAHNYSGSNSDVVTNGRSVEWSDVVDVNAGVTSTNGNHTHSFTTASSGSGEAHNNIQPSVVVYMWRRVG